MSCQRRSPPQTQTQPATSKLSLTSLLSLPHRLCHPPPPIAKVRSYSVIPIFKIQLEDVLNRRHLPPLGLKDFEEWLLYVEQCPQNLYFILWLKDYTLRYNQWVLQLTPQPTSAADYRPACPTQTSSRLILFYARAKQTFFTPNSDYELDLPSEFLTPFHTAKFTSSPPDPDLFIPLACEVQKLLNESLQRFVLASYTNVGTNRGLCGIFGGIAIALLGSVAPIAYNILTGKTRWLRLTALPGLWLGLLILIASLHGVCMMIYIFGDLRQLRKFELHRPPISRPRPLIPQPPVVSSAVTVPAAITRPPLLPANQPPRLMSMIPSPPPSVVPDRDSRPRTISASSSCNSTLSGNSISDRSEEVGEIHISPAYFDELPVNIASVVDSMVPDADHDFPAINASVVAHNDTPFIPTASFIHPYHHMYDGCDSLGDVGLPEHRQPISAFDFDALPSLPYPPPSTPNLADTPQISMPPAVVIQPDKMRHDVRLSPKSLLARAQYQCNLNTWRVNLVGDNCEKKSLSQNFTSNPASPSDSKPYSSQHRLRIQNTAATVHARFKAVKMVPAFASPVTRVLNPIVVRAQWEIVVRSALLAFKASCLLLIGLLFIPVKRK